MPGPRRCGAVTGGSPPPIPRHPHLLTARSHGEICLYEIIRERGGWDTIIFPCKNVSVPPAMWCNPRRIPETGLRLPGSTALQPGGKVLPAAQKPGERNPRGHASPASLAPRPGAGFQAETRGSGRAATPPCTPHTPPRPRSPPSTHQTEP